MATATAYPHIQLNDQGVPIIAGTTTKVVEVVLDRLAYGWDAEEIHRHHPDLSLAGIHSAFAYYYDHREELDRYIAEQRRIAAEIRESLGESLIRRKLEERGPLP